MRQKTQQWVPRVRLGAGLDGDKEQQHFWSDGTILNLDGGDGFIKIYIMVPVKKELCT